MEFSAPMLLRIGWFPVGNITTVGFTSKKLFWTTVPPADRNVRRRTDSRSDFRGGCRGRNRQGDPLPPSAYVQNVPGGRGAWQQQRVPFAGCKKSPSRMATHKLRVETLKGNPVEWGGSVKGYSLFSFSNAMPLLGLILPPLIAVAIKDRPPALRKRTAIVRPVTLPTKAKALLGKVISEEAQFGFFHQPVTEGFVAGAGKSLGKGPDKLSFGLPAGIKLGNYRYQLPVVVDHGAANNRKWCREHDNGSSSRPSGLVG